MAENTARTWKRILTIVTLLLLAAIVYFSRQEIVETIANLSRVNMYALALVPVWLAIKTHAFAMFYKQCFEILKIKIPYRPMFRISLELNFVNNVFPSAGVSGFSYFGVRMQQFKVSAGKATLVHMLRWVMVFMSFQVLLFFGLFLLASTGKASNIAILVASSMATFLFVGTAGTAYIIGSRRRIDHFFTFLTKILNKLIQLIRPKHPETIKIEAAQRLFFDLHDNYLVIRKNYKKLRGPFLYATLANVAEIAVIYCIYLAFNNYVNIGAIIIAYIIANFAGLISVLPGGVGVYEGLMTATLATVGVPPAISIPATIMYRVLTSAIQLPIGYYFYHRALYGEEKDTKT